MENALILESVFAILISWEKIVLVKFAKMIVTREANALKANAIAFLDLKERRVNFKLNLTQ